MEVHPPAEREAVVHERIHVVKLCRFKGLMANAETLDDRSNVAARTARLRFGMDILQGEVDGREDRGQESVHGENLLYRNSKEEIMGPFAGYLWWFEAGRLGVCLHMGIYCTFDLDTPAVAIIILRMN